MPDGICSAAGCEGPVRAKGFCQKHYRQHWESQQRCSVEGCDSCRSARGLCQKHYRRWQRNGNTDLYRKPPCSIEGCEEPSEARGWCQSHYDRWYRHGDPLAYFPQTTDERFWSKVDKTLTCWLWTGGKDHPTGYGRVGVGGATVLAHRRSYEHLVGPIPKGLELDHLCRRPACVRPTHLQPVTHRENMRRARLVRGLSDG